MPNIGIQNLDNKKKTNINSSKWRGIPYSWKGRENNVKISIFFKANVHV